MRKLIFVLILFFGFGYPLLAQNKISLEDIQVYGTFYEKKVAGLRSMNSGLYYTVLEDGNKIVRYSYKTGEKVSFMKAREGLP